MALIAKPKKREEDKKAEIAFIAGAPDANKNKARIKNTMPVTIHISNNVEALLEERRRSLGLTRSKYTELAIAFCISQNVGLADLFKAADEIQK